MMRIDPGAIGFTSGISQEHKCNIPNFQFGMLYTRSSLHIIFYCILVDPRNSTQLKDPRRELGIFPVFHI